MEAALVAVEGLDVATIAVVEGTAAGAGCQLALACDLSVLTRSARIGMPVLRLGLVPSPMFALRIAALTGQERARQLFYTGALLGAEKAQQWGLVSEVVDDDEVEDRRADLVGAVIAQPRSGIVGAKAACRAAADQQRSPLANPEWRYSDPVELPQRMRAFLSGREHERATT
jgi:enoyl-CoA hydratase/carnithine racemase